MPADISFQQPIQQAKSKPTPIPEPTVATSALLFLGLLVALKVWNYKKSKNYDSIR